MPGGVGGGVQVCVAGEGQVCVAGEGQGLQYSCHQPCDSQRVHFPSTHSPTSQPIPHITPHTSPITPPHHSPHIPPHSPTSRPIHPPSLPHHAPYTPHHTPHHPPYLSAQGFSRTCSSSSSASFIHSIMALAFSSVVIATEVHRASA